MIMVKTGNLILEDITTCREARQLFNTIPLEQVLQYHLGGEDPEKSTPTHTNVIVL